MKILFISNSYPKSNTPYLGIWAHQQALSLKEMGMDVEVVSIVPFVPRLAGVLSEKIKNYTDIPKHEQYDGIIVHHPRFLRFKPESLIDRLLFHGFWVQSYLIAARLRKKLDITKFQIMHAHNLFPDGASAYYLHKKYGIPYVLTLHDVDKFSSCPKKGFQRAISLQIIQNAQKVLVVSKRVKNNIHSHVDESKLELLYNTFRTNGSPDRANGFVRKKIVTIASLIERKGIHILLQAFQKVNMKHPDYQLIVVGNGRDMESLVKLSEDLNIHSSVVFTGTLEHEMAMKWLSQASIFCLPSWEEAFGVVYAEAMSYGIPIIGSKGEGIADIVEDRSNGVLVEPKNIEELEKALLYLIENENEARRIGLKGYETIQELQPRRFGHKLIEFYKKIALQN